MLNTTGKAKAGIWLLVRVAIKVPIVECPANIMGLRDIAIAWSRVKIKSRVMPAEDIDETADHPRYPTRPESRCY